MPWGRSTGTSRSALASISEIRFNANSRYYPTAVDAPEKMVRRLGVGPEFRHGTGSRWPLRSVSGSGASIVEELGVVKRGRRGAGHEIQQNLEIASAGRRDRQFTESGGFDLLVRIGAVGLQ